MCKRIDFLRPLNAIALSAIEKIVRKKHFFAKFRLYCGRLLKYSKIFGFHSRKIFDALIRSYLLFFSFKA